MFVGLRQVGGGCVGGPSPLTVQLEKASLWQPGVRIGVGEEKAVLGTGGPELPLHLVSAPPSLPACTSVMLKKNWDRIYPHVKNSPM